MLAHPNLETALKRVKQNRGSPGPDGMTVEDLGPYLQENWPQLRAALLEGRYQPAPVRRHEIRKDSGGMRTLGIPTVLDRFIQQALLQVLQPRIDPTFSEHSYGFRPGRSAQGAVRRAQDYIESGREIVVDVDLERFFDRVNHDVLMGRVARRIADRRVLRLLRRYLESGVMANGVVIASEEGTPQGGPLSPLLANVLLDEVDQELERRGHAFVRYADDCNVYVRTERAGERVFASLRKQYAKLRLKVNESKSAVAPVWERKFLGFSFLKTQSGAVRRTVAPPALKKLKSRVRTLTCRTGGRSIQVVVGQLSRYLRGWHGYFGFAEAADFKKLDGWIRRRLRTLHLTHWRHGTRAYSALRELGASDRQAKQVACHTKRWWRTSAGPIQTVLSTRYFTELGLYPLGG
jgi:group II intron reverse transcriptase/maturase